MTRTPPSLTTALPHPPQPARPPVPYIMASWIRICCARRIQPLGLRPLRLLRASSLPRMMRMMRASCPAWIRCWGLDSTRPHSGSEDALNQRSLTESASNNAIATGAGAGDETRPAACPEDCPVEPLRESVASMETLLREWFEGLGGSPSVQELEERFGNRWRYTSALRQRFYVRRKLVR